MTEAVLVGDVGGTTTRFAVDDGSLVVVKRSLTASASSLAHAIEPVLSQMTAPPSAIVVAVAGPVRDGRAELTNANWTGDVRTLPGPAKLLNDLEAAAHGVGVVPEACIRHVGGRASVSGARRVVVGVGTGHGQAIWNDGVAIAGEGGHAGFAPLDAEQRRYVDFLRERKDRVSIEDVVSGRACDSLLSFYDDALGPAARQLWSESSGASVISCCANTDEACRKALLLMTRALGAVAGDAALRTLPDGGVWLIGGLAEQMLQPEHDEILREAFEAKGRMSYAVRDLPLFVVRDPDVGLRGAVVVARTGMH